jgi:hypothetical protein
MPALTVIETFGKFGDGMRAFASGSHRQGDQCQDRGQLMPFALGLAGIGQPIPQTLPEPRQLIGRHRASRRQGPLMLGQVRGQFWCA